MTPTTVDIDNLEDILTGIWSGRLEHNQQFYFCDSAACLAGWDYCKRNKQTPLFADENEKVDFWEEARIANGLNEGEATLLFHGCTTRTIHTLVLEAFKKGRRVVPPKHISASVDLAAPVATAYNVNTLSRPHMFHINSDSYYMGATIWCIDSSTAMSLVDFLFPDSQQDFSVTLSKEFYESFIKIPAWIHYSGNETWSNTNAR